LEQVEKDVVQLVRDFRHDHYKALAISMSAVVVSLGRARAYMDEIGPLRATLKEAAENAGIRIDSKGDISEEMPGLVQIIAQLKNILEMEGHALEVKLLYSLSMSLLNLLIRLTLTLTLTPGKIRVQTADRDPSPRQRLHSTRGA